MTRYSGTADQLSSLRSSFWGRNEVEIPKQVPNNTVQWGILTKRAVEGFISLRQLTIKEDGTIFLRRDSQIYSAAEELTEYQSEYSFNPEQGISLSISLKEIGRIPLQQRTPRSEEVVAVDEIVLVD
ncbi:hypothetical protein YH66_09685 [[Brevibacterium] flavum]|uniref:Uncharacterized protein n=1 Tax=[Brevibacterium] flavum TaxID=92706 RepID=A0A0F6WQU4_9CORY|nr:MULTISPECIES: hypothetical protein [Corynebacterium]AKF27801.1 hypothetical protein YH66_09685 [[Brevibacterium] flavum]ANE08633.1 hypothetical protein A3654_09745 [Corynebacterium glutamicum]AST21046.1 hypothetical protein CEY17_09825 [Corynebacterium glutamicum ATCC 14067]KEI23555.1 hypothetical protein KIQ_013595 [Corynebacterium glutamicum ATCC 14067]KIH73303.1 hypothetical protein SD36_09715 [Corynebacterium glutamicum]